MRAPTLGAALAAFCFLTVSSLSAQPFRLVLVQGDSASLIGPGSPVTLNAAVGSTVTARINGTYTGTGRIELRQPPTLIGAPAFTAALLGGTPATLNPGNQFVVEVTFRPTAATLSSAQFSLAFVEVTRGAPSDPEAQTTGTLGLTLQGTSPAFSLSYLLQSDQNVVPLAPNGTLVFPAAPLGLISQGALNVTNTGSGAGLVTALALTSGGGAFRLSRNPLFPQLLPPGQTLQVLVLYEPSGAALDTGQIRVTFGGGATALINLEGTGVAARFTYELLQTDPPAVVVPGGTIELPSVDVGQTSTALVRVTNAGNAAGPVSAIALAGAGFQLADGPALPQTLVPGTSLTFSILFTPTRPGTARGALIVNSDRLVLSGVGLGPQLVFNYPVGGVPVTVEPPAGSIFFSPVAVGEQVSTILTVSNTGTRPAPISSIGIAPAEGAFTILSLPPLPLSLAPGQSFPLTVIFRPVATGFSSATLRVDSAALNLVGSGTAPPPLPGYTITGPTGAVAPGQSLVGLTLNSPYPVALTGTLTLASSASLPPDPAAQFATGSTTVRFVIPANTTRAIFGALGTAVGLQTGTVANSFLITPTFATQAGNVDLTPASPATLAFSIAAARPSVIAAGVAGQTATGFTLSVAGISTARSLTAVTVEFVPAAGVQLAATRFTIDLQAASALWFRSAASQASGGQFTITLPFSLQGTLPAGQLGLASLGSVNIVVSNELGSSAPVTVRLQ